MHWAGVALVGTGRWPASNSVVLAERPYSLTLTRFIYPTAPKLTDADGELQETLHWLDTAQACSYLSAGEHSVLTKEAESVGRLPGGMLSKHETFCIS